MFKTTALLLSAVIPLHCLFWLNKLENERFFLLIEITIGQQLSSRFPQTGWMGLQHQIVIKSLPIQAPVSNLTPMYQEDC